MFTPLRRVASFVGVLPGPRNGMTLSTQQVVDRLGGECDLRTFDIGVTFKKTGWSWRVRKAIGSIRSGVAIWGWQSRDNENIYLIANSTDGLLYNIWQAWIARRRGFRCVLHHHVYHYIETHDWKMSWLLRVAGKDCLHIMACRRMVDDFNSTYSTAVRHLVAPPAVVRARDSAVTRPHSTFAIGHLSNLSVEKGLVELLQTVDLLIKDGIDVRLVLAGPCASVEAKRLVATAQQRVGSRIEYRGPIHGPDTDSFFDDIDVFLFPTRIESWGIVLNESLASGVPVISADRGCVSWLVGDGGYVLESRVDFAEIAASRIANWIRRPESYARIRQRSVTRGIELQEHTEKALAELVQAILE